MISGRSHTSIAERTKDDGNCLVNATALAIFQPEVWENIFARLEKKGIDPHKKFRKFVPLANSILKPAVAFTSTVDAIQALIDFRFSNPVRFQGEMAYIFINISALTPDTLKSSDFVAILIGAFDAYCRRELELDGNNQDDIFTVHGFITQKFAEIFKKYLSTIQRCFGDLNDNDVRDLNLAKAIKKELLTWWNAYGARAFLFKMKLNRQWRGNFELKQIAQYFDVNFLLDNNIYQLPIYNANGRVNRNTFRPIEEILIDKGIVDNIGTWDEGTELQLLRLSQAGNTLEEQKAACKQVLVERLQDVVDYPLMRTFISEWEEQFLPAITCALTNPNASHYSNLFDPNLPVRNGKYFERKANYRHVPAYLPVNGLYSELRKFTQTIPKVNSPTTKFTPNPAAEISFQKPTRQGLTALRELSIFNDKQQLIRYLETEPNWQLPKIKEERQTLLNEINLPSREIATDANGKVCYELKDGKISYYLKGKEKQQTLKDDEVIYRFGDKEFVIDKINQIKLDELYAKQLLAEEHQPMHFKK